MPTETPKISVCMVTRGRPIYAVALLQSMRATATHSSAIEWLVACDDDDADTVYALQNVGWLAYLGIGPPGRGYADLHLRWNALARASRGDWLMLIPDDAEVGPGWDAAILAAGDGARRLAVLCPAGDSGMLTFPVVSRRLYNLIGHVGRCAHVDTWLGVVARKAQIMVPLPNLRIRHRRGEAQFCDATEAATVAAKPLTGKEWDEAQSAVYEDVYRVQDAVRAQNA